MFTPILFILYQQKAIRIHLKAKLLKRSAKALHYINANKMQRRAGSS